MQTYGWVVFRRRGSILFAILAAAIMAAVAFGLWESRFDCHDPRHGCAYVFLGSLLIVPFGLLCAGLAYWLRPTRGRSGISDQAT